MDSINFVVEVRPCDYGEILTVTNTCYVCDENYYSIEAGATNCKECPEEAICLGGINMFPKKDYWRSGWNSDVFHECRVLDA